MVLVGLMAGSMPVSATHHITGGEGQAFDGSWLPIELVEEGDMVWAMDPESGESGPREVAAFIPAHPGYDMVDITMGGSTITATVNHPFWVIGEGWTDAGDLEAGDHLLQADGGLEVVDAVHEYQLVTTVYNFEVAGLHTYFVEVDGEGVLVHNCAKVDGAKRQYRDIGKHEKSGGRRSPSPTNGEDMLQTAIPVKDDLLINYDAKMREHIVYRGGMNGASGTDTSLP